MTREDETSQKPGGVGPLVLLVPLLVLIYAVLNLLDSGDPVALPGKLLVGGAPAQERPSSVQGWLGGVALPEGGRLDVRLTPFEAVDSLQEFHSRTLAHRFDLGEGQLWRLELELSAEAPERLVIDPHVIDGIGTAQSVPVVTRGSDHPALATLIAPPTGPMRGGDARQLALWGRTPGEEARFEVSSGSRRAVVELVPAEIPTRFLPRPILFTTGVSAVESANAGEAGSPVTQDDPRDARIAELEEELRAERRRRQERELEWYEFNRALGALRLDEVGIEPFPVDPELVPEAGEGEPEEEIDEEAARLAARSGEVHQALRILLKRERLDGMDLVESGRLKRGGIGPAIFRTLDDRGRLTGSLHAEVLRLEASRAARTLTLVLDGGFESRGGERTPFAGGERRIVLFSVDPEDWMEYVPELFSPTDLNPEYDDGLWNLSELRRELNRLLGLDTSAGWYRIKGLGGVLGDRYVDVQLEAYDTAGHLERRLFADSMRILSEPPGVQLVLEGGAVVRGAQKRGFSNGVHRVFLPRAPLEDWRAARLPSLGPVASEPAPSDSEASGDD